MLVWLITVGEPLPTDGTNDRLHRAGILAKFLVEKGHQVEWWTSTYNHSRKKQRFNKDTFINLSDRYKINLLHSVAYKKNVSVRRLINHYGIARKFLKLAQIKQQPDVILCSLPTLELSLAATEYGKETGVPVVVDIRDLWPDLFLDLAPKWGKWIAKLMLYPMFKTARAACSNASAIIGVTPHYVQWGLNYANRGKTPLDTDFPFTYIDTNPTEDEISISIKRWDSYDINNNTNKFICCFFGAIGRQFELEPIIEAARRLQKANRSFKFVLCGDGDNLAYYKRLAKDCDNIVFPGWVEFSDIWTLLRMSKVGLAPYKNVKNFALNLPNKPVEYFSAGLPVISSLKGFLENILTEFDCGITYSDVENLTNHLTYLYDNPERLAHMSENAYKLYKEKFIAEKVLSDITTYLQSICKHEEYNKGT